MFFFSISFPFISSYYFSEIIEIMTFIHNCEWADQYQIVGFDFIHKIGVALRHLAPLHNPQTYNNLYIPIIIIHMFFKM